MARLRMSITATEALGASAGSTFDWVAPTDQRRPTMPSGTRTPWSGSNPRSWPRSRIRPPKVAGRVAKSTRADFSSSGICCFRPSIRTASSASASRGACWACWVRNWVSSAPSRAFSARSSARLRPESRRAARQPSHRAAMDWDGRESTSMKVIQ